MPVWPIRGGGYEVMEAARCGEAKGVSRPSGTDVWIDGVRYLGTVGEATGIASSAGYRVSCRAKGRPQQRRRVQPVGGSPAPAPRSLQQQSALIKSARPRRKGMGNANRCVQG